MSTVSTFSGLLQHLSLVMTVPTFNNFMVIVAGWIFASRRTVTAIIVAAGAVELKHHSTFHRVFALARWSLDELGLAVFALILGWIPHGAVFLGVDDTLARKRGLKMFGVGMHHDPLLSSRKKTVVNWGHNWVVLGVIIRLPFCDHRYFCLPILFRLYVGKKVAEKKRLAYRTRSELTVQMVQLLCSRYENRCFHLLGDSAYGGQTVLNHLPPHCELTSRLTMNARLYDPPPVRRPGRNGRPRRRGGRLPTPEQMLQKRVRRTEMQIYGKKQRMRVTDCEARVYAAPDRPLRCIAIEPLGHNPMKQAFYSTCFEASADEVLSWYAMRWSIEVTFHDSKQHLGFQEPQGWTRRAVERTAPIAMLLYSLVVLWFAKHGYRDYQAPNRPWYTHKTGASFADMLATLRKTSIREQVLSMGLSGRGSRKVVKTLLDLVEQLS